MLNYAYCPNCGKQLSRYPNNNKFSDFFCKGCCEDYELKSKSGNLTRKIVDGAFNVVCSKINNNTQPNLFILNYDKDNLSVNNLFVIPKHFFHIGVIDERKPLSDKARRKGWVGCNIDISAIPKTGWIYIIKQADYLEKERVLENWQSTLFLRSINTIQQRTWILDVLNCIDSIKKEIFTLDDMYRFESVLSEKHPRNYHIKDKIRQQLQFLRNKNFIEFLGNGTYKVINYLK